MLKSILAIALIAAYHGRNVTQVYKELEWE